MFTTANHIYYYIAFGLYAASLALAFLRRPRLGLALLGAGVFLHGAYLLGRGFLGGVFIANPVLEGPYFLPFCLAAIAFGAGCARSKKSWKAIVFITLPFMVFSLFYAKGMIPPTPKTKSFWAVLFFVSESSAHAFFYIGAVFAVAMLIKGGGDPHFRPFVIWGFVLYTIAQVTGAIWSYLGWGNTFNWNPRHLSSASIWMLYMAILHVKYVPSWTIKRQAVLSVLGGGYLLVVTYLHYLKEMSFPRIGG